MSNIISTQLSASYSICKGVCLRVILAAAAAAVAAAGCRFEALVPLEVRCAHMSELVVVVAVAMIL